MQGLRVVTVIGRMNVGGPAQQVAWLTQGMIEGGNRATLITGTIGPGEDDMTYVARAAGVEPIVIPELGRELTWKDGIAVWKLYRQLCTLKPDVVHTHTAKAGAVGRLAAWLYRWMRPSTLWGRPKTCRCVHTFHGHIFHSYFGPLKTRTFLAIERFLGRWLTDRIIVLSERQRDEIHKTFRVGRADQFAVIPVAVDVQGLHPRRAAKENDLRQELSLDKDALLVGIVGRLAPIKNHELFIHAVSELIGTDEFNSLKVHFAVIGDGELRRELEQRVTSLELNAHVTFLGHRSDPATFYASLDVVVLTSNNEGAPMSLLEAMAAGVPIVSTLVGGVPDLLGSCIRLDAEGFHICERGLGVPAGQVTGLAHAISRLLTDPQLRTELTQAGRQYVSQNSSREHLVLATSQLYSQLLNVPSHPLSVRAIDSNGRKASQTLSADTASPLNGVGRMRGPSEKPGSSQVTKSFLSDSHTDSPSKDSQGMRILITGGAGFIGSHLADACLDRGDEVVVIDDLSTGRWSNVEHLLDSPRFTLHVGDVRNEAVLEPLVENCECIFHLAAAVGVKLVVESPVRTIETNIQGTETVLRAAARHGRRVLITSTSEVYGLSTKVPFREEDNLVMGASTTGRWSYACSKAIDEFLALAYYKERNLPSIVVRLFNTVGPRQTGRYGMVIPTFIRQALQGEPITVHGDGRQTRCFSFVTDVVAALMALMDEPTSAGEVFNIGSDEEVSIAELAEMVKVKTASTSDIVIVPYSRAYGSGFEDMPRRVPDVSKLKKQIGFGPSHSLEEILDGVIVSIREELQGSKPERNGSPVKPPQTPTVM